MTFFILLHPRNRQNHKGQNDQKAQKSVNQNAGWVNKGHGNENSGHHEKHSDYVNQSKPSIFGRHFSQFFTQWNRESEIENWREN